MKKHRVNRIMTFILVLALSVSTLLTGCGKNNDKIVLGWIGPLTGEMTIWGTAEMQALTMAVEDTNAAGGLLGKEVELKTYDNRGDAVENHKCGEESNQQDGCIALFGCNTSACAIALSEVCAQFNIPQIATTATNSKLTQDDDGTVHPIPSAFASPIPKWAMSWRSMPTRRWGFVLLRLSMRSAVIIPWALRRTLRIPL